MPDVTLENHQQRVVEEKNELQEKLSKLNEFLASKDVLELSLKNRLLMTEQAEWMSRYLAVLEKRIALF
ncbi:hypothetical protein LIN78_11950 [Leeia sp. TBRC 13508]|uniref:Uncharacterized protein n=1 Tax=Leeia speluncae TaxID=2884804 RepID=A0ABS8D808_9NEIS|nr:hypothetical protein [Leeia speluncae]MCB6184257.1 hypothetical protein [Leeia speluncae]